MFNYSEDFLKKLKNWDHNAFSKFYLDTIDVFYRYIKLYYNFDKNEINDILSDFYLKIWNIKHNIKLDNFNFWLWTVFKNFLYDRYKVSNKEMILNDEYLSDNFLDILELEYKKELILNSLKELPEIYKDILYLKLIEDKSYEEISNILWISYDTCRQRYSRALKMLKNKLDNII